MGIPGEFDRPEFRAAVKKILEAVHAAGKFCILFTVSKDTAREALAGGYDSVTFSLDAAMIIDGVNACMKEIKGQRD